MERALITTLLVVGLGSTSCEMLPEQSLAPGALPQVSAPPPEAAAPQAERTALRVEKPHVVSVADPVAPTVAPFETNPEVEKVLAQLEQKRTGLSPRELRALSHTVVSEARRHGLEPALVLAVIHVESRGYHLAVSPVGAVGLMQLMPATGAELADRFELEWRGADSLFDPELNVKLGVAYLKQLSDRYESLPTALAAYNWGPGRIDRRIRRGASLPKIYVKQVMKAYDQAALRRTSRSS